MQVFLRMQALMITLGILLFSAVNGNSEPLSEESDHERGPITFAAGRDTSGTLLRVTEKWNQKHPTEKVTILDLPFSTDEQRISMAQNFQAGSSRYDVVLADLAWSVEFAARGWLEPLEEQRFARSTIFRAAADTARFEGKLFGVAYSVSAGMLFYRSDLIKSPPRTWAELQYLCHTMSKQMSIGCYAGQFAQYEGLTVNVAESIASAGGSIVSGDGSEVTVNTAQAREGLRFLVDGFEQGWIPRAAITYKEEDGRRAFQQGQLLFLRNWPYVYNLANLQGPDSTIVGKVKVARLPGASGLGRSIIGGSNLMLSRFSRHKASAKDWMEFMQSEEAQIELDNPVFEKLYDDATLTQRLPYLPVLKEIIISSASRPSTANYHGVSLIIQKNAYAALQGRKSVDRAISDMAGELKEALRNRP
jgi:multiple sugar transport system substrate-binding protein